MKRFFGIGKKTPREVTHHSAEPSQRSILAQPIQTLHPKFSLPPVPHPRPHERIAILAVSDGLFLRPHIPFDDDLDSTTQTVLWIPWRKPPIVEQVTIDSEDIAESDWDQALVVYGIVGFLELFSAAHLLVISAKTDLGHILDPDHAVHAIKSVASIPLISFEQARTAINTIGSRNKSSRLKPAVSPTLDTPRPADANIKVVTQDESAAEQYVQFAGAPQEDEDRVSDAGSSISEESTLHSLTDSESTSSAAPSAAASAPNVAQTIAQRLSFWKGPSASALPTVPSPEDHDGPPEQVLGTILQQALEGEVPHSDERQSELDDKILKECIREFSRGEMFFAYSFDITRSLQSKHQSIKKAQQSQGPNIDPTGPAPEEVPGARAKGPSKNCSSPSVLNGGRVKLSEEEHNPGTSIPFHPLAEPSCTLPLWRRVDRQFWWNEWLLRPFVDAGLHGYVLPIMQGYIETSNFSIPTLETPAFTQQANSESVIANNIDGSAKNKDIVENEVPVLQSEAPVQYIIISRRSKERAGLRYQRRGIDDEARVANFVETEAIVRIERDTLLNVFSFVQIRGSIPLYWVQAGNSLKPPPQLSTDRTREQNKSVLKRHFERTIAVYGPHTIVNLAEQQGKEGAVTRAYATYMAELNMQDARYNGYDFHIETRGMKYENISKLVERMRRAFESQGFFWVSGNNVLSEQHGTFRVNCIDCLDRTNVVQSAFARHVLDRQLGAVALHSPSLERKSDMDVIFNNLWANNGDAISRAYAGTSALKGDFTRTGKRDLSGLLSDGVNSLARMYSSTFSDWFSQAVIDYMVGNRTLGVFSEFLIKLSSSDPRDLIRLSKIRAEAIATSVSRVLSEGETLLSGWTLFSPEGLNTKVGNKWEEKVLLLAVGALYVVSYDYTLQKVKAYTRVPLGDIVDILKGPYILNALEEASCNPRDNSGFVITWRNHNQETRVTSYSLRNSTTPPSSPSTPGTRMSGSFSRAQASSSVLPRMSLSFKRKSTLSSVLDNAAGSTLEETSFAAFKVLPMDLTRIRRGSKLEDHMEPANDLSSATSCEEAVSLVVHSIQLACQEVGNINPDFVKEGAVVSLAEAQRMISVFARMEHGVKKLLWLGS